jgi:protein ImuB
LLSKPEAIGVMAEIPEGAPVRFTWRRVMHKVTSAQGPERIEPEWWRHLDTPEQVRDYYALEDAQGARFWVFREGRYGEGSAQTGSMPAWFVHGLFA